MKYSDYYCFFGLVSIILGLIGFFRAKSVPSLVAGGLSGIVLVVAATMSWKREVTGGVNWGYVLGLVISVLLLGRFLPGFLKSKKFYPAGIMALLSILGIVVGILGLIQ